MRKSPTRHHARFHRDRVIRNWESLLWNHGIDCHCVRQTYFVREVKQWYPRRWPEQHNRYHKFSRIYAEAFWVRISHHARYRDDRTHWRRYMERHDVGTRLRLVHDWYW